MTEEKKQFYFADLVADTVRAHHGAFAYMYVLEQLENKQGHDRQLWLDVLDELDNIERKEDAIPRVQTSTERIE
jgi:hypothetical protein